MACLALLMVSTAVPSLIFAQAFTKADTLRGSITAERAWWNVLRYDLAFAPDFDARYIEGVQRITFETLDSGSVMQVDLQAPMQIVQALYQDDSLHFTNNGNVWYLHFKEAFAENDTAEVSITFAGTPKTAVNPPWDGGWIWSRDKLNRPWMSVACQGLGASVWFPCKDHQSDEPDLGASMSITVPDSMVAVSNGRLMAYTKLEGGMHGFGWEVSHPINSYNMVPYIGSYAHWEDAFEGKAGTLSLDFWVLDYEMEKAKTHFTQVNRMLSCFEEWLGPYPFYDDGYKLVQAPHLGMEHQSGIAYGNKFANGYRGSDLSGSGWGLKWDFIIIHESGHEWFGNSITTADIADMWVHEAFTAYSEALFTECNYGVQAGQEYVIGTRSTILNDKPIAGPYGVNKRGSGDMYYKGANMIHTIRHIMDNDSLFKAMLLEMNRVFFHQVVTGHEVEHFISQFSGRNFTPVFDQYLRSTAIPEFEYSIHKGKLYYRWVNTVPEFDMPLRLADGSMLYPTTSWQHIAWKKAEAEGVTIDPNFFAKSKRIQGLPQGL